MPRPNSKNDVDLLVAWTGQDRETVLRVLLQSCGDKNIALKRLQTREVGQMSRVSEAAASDGVRSETERTVQRLPVGPRTTAGNEATASGSGSSADDREEALFGGSRKKSPDDEYLTLKVLRPLQEGEHHEIHFRVKRTTQLGKLKKSYSERIKAPVFILRFLFDGRRIENEHTPEFLGMETGDFIEVYNELGNCSSVVNNAAAAATTNAGGATAEVTATTTHTTTTAAGAAAAAAIAGGGTTEKPSTAGGSDNARQNQNRRMSRRVRGAAVWRDTTLEDDLEYVEPSSPASPAPKRARAAAEVPAADDQESGAPDRERAELLAIKAKYDNLVRKLRDKVECPVCMDVPKRAPVPVCSNGHVVCSKCLRQECPTCRVRMTNGTSLLALTVIENIDHYCDWEGCIETRPLPDLTNHMAACPFRRVKCPGLECGDEISLIGITAHAVTCCVERGEVKELRLPHQFTYVMSESLEDLSSQLENFNWNLEGIKFDSKVFFLKVTRNARRATWYFLVQSVGGAEECSAYTLNMVVLKGDGVLDGKYSMNYSGDVCPIDVASIGEAEDKGLCLALRDGVMAKILTKNNTTGGNEFCVLVNIVKA